MGRVADTLQDIRYTLADTGAQRWTDARLIKLIDEAHKLLCIKANLLRGEIIIPIVGSKVTYDLPADTHQPYRVLWNGRDPLPIKSYKEMDDYRGENPGWELDEGSEVELVIFDKQVKGTIKTYPIMPAVGTTVNMPVVLGVLTDINDAAFSSVFGVATDIEFSQEGAEFTEYLQVFYHKYPSDITTSLGDFEFDDTLDLDVAIEYYVVGRALRDDMDSQNRQVGNESLAMFEAKLKDAQAASSKHYYQPNNRKTSYRSGI